MATLKDSIKGLGEKSANLSQKAAPARYRYEQAGKKQSTSLNPFDQQATWKAKFDMLDIEDARDEVNKNSSALRYAALQRKMKK